MKDITTSIIIPVYNVEAYLRRCIDSALAQTMQNIEIILVDDGSTDQSGKICDDYAAQFTNIIVIHQQNSGPSTARNKGLLAAHGKYILFIDSDDYILPDACQKLIELAEKYQCEIVRGNGKMKDEQGEKNYPKAPQTSSPITGVQFLAAMLQSQPALTVCPPFALYKKAFLLQHKLFFPTNLYYEDELWMPQVYLKAQSVISTNYYFYYHWRVANSRSSSWSNRREQDMLKICNTLYGLYAQQPRNYRRILCNGLCTLYLNAIILSKDKHANRKFTLKTAYSWRNYCKALIFFLSPAFYFQLHHFCATVMRKSI